MTLVNGWTVLSPSADSRLVYVATDGNDADAENNQHGRRYYLPSDPEIGGDPQNPAQPQNIKAYQTISRAVVPIRGHRWRSETNNVDDYGPLWARPEDPTEHHPDWLLFRRGQTFPSEDYATTICCDNGGNPVVSNNNIITMLIQHATGEQLGGSRGGYWGGRSESERAVITAWGVSDSEARPVLEDVLTIDDVTGNIAITSIESRIGFGGGTDPRPWDSNRRGCRNVLIEDCKGVGGSTNLTWFTNVVIRRCQSLDKFNLDSHNSGLFIMTPDKESKNPNEPISFILEECVFDRNGYRENQNEPTTWTYGTAGSIGSDAIGTGYQPKRSTKDRNIYAAGYDSLHLRGNIFSRGGGGGSIQMRVGGVAERNLFMWNPSHLSVGHTEAYEPYWNSGFVKDNCFMHNDHFLPPAGAHDNAIAIEATTYPIIITKNIITKSHRTTGSYTMIRMLAKTESTKSPASPADTIIVVDNDLHLDGGKEAFSIFDGGDIRTLIIRDNALYSGDQKDTNQNWHFASFVRTNWESAQGLTGEPWDISNNNYFSDASIYGFRYVPFSTTQPYNLSQWQDAGFDIGSTIHPNKAALSTAAGWTDPDRSILTYMQAVDPNYVVDENVYVDDDTTGQKQTNRVEVWKVLSSEDQTDPHQEGAFTTADAKQIAREYHAFISFIQKARNNRKGAWDSRWTAEEVNNYIRAGFGYSSITGDYDNRDVTTRVLEFLSTTHGPVTSLVLTTQPSAGTSGDLLVTQPVVALRDADNITAASDNTTQVSVAIQSGANGTLGGTTTVTVVNGVATFTDLTLTGDAGESYVLRFSITSPALHVDSNPISVTLPPGGGGGEDQVPTTIVITTQPVPNYSEFEFTSQPVLVIKDQDGSVITSDNTSSVRAALNGSNGSLQGTNLITAVDGVYAFTNLGVNGDPNITYSLTFESSEPDVNDVTSDDFNLLFDEPAPEIPSASPIPTVIRNDRYIPYLMSINIDGDFNRGDLLSLRVNQTQFMGTGTKEFIVNYRNTLLYNREQNYNIPEDWDVFWSKTLGPVKNPNQIAPCFAWYKPEKFTASDDGATYTTLSNSSLYAANDSDNFIQETTSQQAGRTAYGLNGFIPLDFDGVDDVFVNPEDTSRFNLPLNVDFVWGFVIVPGASTGSEQIIFSQGAVGEDNSLQIILDDSNGNNRIKFNTQYDGTPETVLSGDGAYTVGNPVIIIVSRVGGDVKFRCNGVEPGFPPIYSDIPYNSIYTTDAAYIGAGFDADTETLVDFFSGDFYEMVLLKETQELPVDQLSYREELEGYFAEKYKLKSLLPSGHPFSINPPRASVIKEEPIPDETLPQYDCTITRTTVSNTQFDDGTHAGETIAVETQSDCQWRATTNDSWITLTNTAYIGNGTVTFDIGQHTGQSDRTGSITIITVTDSTETISITQTAVSSVPWDPSMDADVFGWWDTSTLTTADTVTNGNGDESLLEFYDEISSTRATTFDFQTIDDHGPILVTGTQNGNAILEQASTSGLFGSLSTSNLGGTGTFTEVTFVSVSRNTSQGTTGFTYTGGLLMSILDGAGKFARVGWSDQGSGQVATTTRRPFFYTTGGNNRYQPGALVSNVDDWQIYSATFNLVTGDCEFFVNGTSHDTRTFATPVGSISKSTARVSVFGNTSYDFYRKTPNGSQGGEFVFAQSIDATLRQKVEGHLAHKWGLTANLPSSHPYKSSAPTT